MKETEEKEEEEQQTKRNRGRPRKQHNDVKKTEEEEDEEEEEEEGKEEEEEEQQQHQQTKKSRGRPPKQRDDDDDDDDDYKEEPGHSRKLNAALNVALLTKILDQLDFSKEDRQLYDEYLRLQYYRDNKRLHMPYIDKNGMPLLDKNGKQQYYKLRLLGDDLKEEVIRFLKVYKLKNRQYELLQTSPTRKHKKVPEIQITRKNRVNRGNPSERSQINKEYTLVDLPEVAELNDFWRTHISIRDYGKKFKLFFKVVSRQIGLDFNKSISIKKHHANLPQDLSAFIRMIIQTKEIPECLYNV